jgi:hypothetical protein
MQQRTEILFAAMSAPSEVYPGAAMIIQETPKRSATIPKRGEKKVLVMKIS